MAELSPIIEALGDLEERDQLAAIEALATMARLIGNGYRSAEHYRREAAIMREERDEAIATKHAAWIENHVNERIGEYRERAQAAERNLADMRRAQRDV